MGENEIDKSEFLNKLIHDFSYNRNVEKVVINALDDFSVDNFIATVRYSSLFVPYRIVILENFDKMPSKSDKEKLVSFLREFRNDNTLVIILSSLTPSRFDRLISDTIQEVGVVKTFWKVFEFNLHNYVSEVLSKNGIEPSKELVELIIARNGQNMSGIAEDIKYLRSYFQANEYVYADKALELLSQKSGESGIFDLIGAIVKGDKYKAILVLNQLFEKGEEPFGFGNILFSQVRKIVKLRKFIDSNLSEEEICKKVGISSFEFKNLRRIVQNMDSRRIKTLLRFVVEFEKAMRSADDTIKLATIEKFIINSL